MISDGNLDFTEHHTKQDGDVVFLAQEEGDGYRFIEHMPEKGKKTLVVIGSSMFYENPDTTFGYARERIKIDLPDILELRLALIDENEGKFTLWDECENLYERAYNERVFEFNRENGEVTFGDGIGGMQPEAGLKVIPVTVKTSMLAKGNVLANQISIANNMYSSFSVHNPKETAGGKDASSSIELGKEIEGKILKTSRAVGESDYIRIIRETPGLIIDEVNVISSREYALWMLLDMVGINSYVLIGRVAGTNGLHAWNLIEINGQHYHVDVTWNLASENWGRVSLNYFLLPDTMIRQQRIWTEVWPRR